MVMQGKYVINMKNQSGKEKFKIAFDAQTLMESQKAGIGRVAESIVRCFEKEEKIQCYLNAFTLGKTSEEMKRLSEYEDKNICIQKCKWYHRGMYLRTWKYIPIPYHCFFKQQADITQFWGYDIPPGVKGKKVVIVHDMAYKTCPETVDIPVRKILERNMVDTCKRADCIITVSNFSKREILRYMDVSPDKIVVMPCGVDHTKYRVIDDESAINVVKKKYNIQDEYYIYVGTLEPRKNVTVLIRAYAELKKSKKDIPQLVLAGKKGWMYQDIFEIVRELQLEGDVIFTGYLGDGEIPLLLNGAVTFLFPSLYEGFGIPPLEAMACGTPVIAANTASIPEVVEDAGFLVEPQDVKDIAEKMWLLYTDKEQREKYRQKGLAQAQKFTWENSARILREVYQMLLSGDGLYE